MKFDEIKKLYADNSSYKLQEDCLKKAYKIAVDLLELVPDDKIRRIIKSGQIAEHVWVNFSDNIVTFYNISIEEAIEIKLTITNKIEKAQKDLQDLLDSLNWDIWSIDLYLYRKNSNVKFCMSENLHFYTLLESFQAIFGDKLKQYDKTNCFCVNSDFFKN